MARQRAQLGVDVQSYKLLVGIAPDKALLQFGYKILEEDPAFAKSLSEVRISRPTPRSDLPRPAPRSDLPRPTPRAQSDGR